jgi:ribonuclease P protein component
MPRMVAQSVCMKEQSYRKLERITKRSRFGAIYQQGVWSSSKHFTTIICSNTQGVKRLGITVTKKVGNAVKRNRIKRLIREFFRLNKALFPAGNDFIIMAKRNMPPLTYQEACRELTELFARKANR